MAYVEQPQDEAPTTRPPEPSPILSSICNLLGVGVIVLGAIGAFLAATDTKIGVGYGIGVAVVFLAVAMLFFGIGQAVQYLARTADASERTADAIEQVAAKWLD